MDLFIPNNSGKKIAASLHQPKGEDVHSLAVLLPGFLDSKDYAHLVRLGEDLAGVGFTAIRFDPTGTWMSEGKIEEYSPRQYLRDLKTILLYMKEKGEYVQILLVGHSLGGMIALLHAAKENDVDAVVAVMFPSSLTRPKQKQEWLAGWERDGSITSRRDDPSNLTNQREYTVSHSFAGESTDLDVLKVIDQLRMPLLFLAAEKDDGLLVEEIKEVYDKANEPKKFLEIKNVNHQYWNSKAQVKKVNKKVIQFLEEYSLV